jgi:uncharacterized membrane protein YeaQ/YmgE (transglycosylase-associated protein family)
MDITFFQNFLTENPALTNILSWLIFGLIVGIIAVFLDPTPTIKGLLSTVILGLLGAFVGGLIANLFTGVDVITGFNLVSFSVAIGGALLLLFLRRLFVSDKGHIKTTTEYKEGER